MPDTKSNPDAPLRFRISEGMLQIEIGIERLADAFHRDERNNPFVDELNDFRQDLKVIDVVEFAKDVRNAMCDEAEDGSTPFTRFLDQMMWYAVDDGCMGVEECQTQKN